MPRLPVLLAAVSVALAGEASARLVPPTSPPVAPARWRSDPRVLAIRELVRGHEAALARHAWRYDPGRRCGTARRGFAAQTLAARDGEGRIRKYVTAEGSERSTYTIEHHYDGTGRLRFALARSSAANGGRVEYRLFFDAWGREVWREVRSRGPTYPFLRPPAFPDGALVRDPATAAALPLRCGP